MTDTAQHTPETWLVDYDEAAKSWNVIVETCWGGEVRPLIVARNLTEANARFIAAAPETAAERDNLKEQMDTMERIAAVRERQFTLAREERDRLKADVAELTIMLEGLRDFAADNATWKDYASEHSPIWARAAELISKNKPRGGFPPPPPPPPPVRQIREGVEIVRHKPEGGAA